MPLVSPNSLIRICRSFTTFKTVFELISLSYHEELLFFVFLRATAVILAMENHLAPSCTLKKDTFLKQYNSARFLHLVMLEMPEAEIIIGEEVSQEVVVGDGLVDEGDVAAPA